MKRTVILILVFIPATWVGVVRADDELPKRSGFDRYQKMLDHSPFAVATAAAAPMAAPDAFKNLYIANVAHTPEADIVTVMSSDDKNLREYLSTKQPNDHGYEIASIEWSDRPGATKVTISKDGKFGTLTFNQALVGGPVANAPSAPQPQPIPQPQPGFSSGNIPRPPARASLPNSAPHTRGVISRSPGTQQLPRE